MATVPSQIVADASMRGISNELDGYVIESENISKTNISEQVPDQNGAIAAEINYDERTDLRLTIRRAKATGTATTITVGSELVYPKTNGVKYVVDSFEEAGSYNGLRRWNVTAHRYTNWPAAK